MTSVIVGVTSRPVRARLFDNFIDGLREESSEDLLVIESSQLPFNDDCQCVFWARANAVLTQSDRAATCFQRPSDHVHEVGWYPLVPLIVTVTGCPTNGVYTLF